MIGLMLFFIYLIAARLLSYKQANDLYSGLESEVVKVVDGPIVKRPSKPAATSAETAAAVEPGPDTPSPIPESPTDPLSSETQPYVSVDISPVHHETHYILELETDPTYPEPQEGLPWLDVDFDALQEKNPDVVGWLHGQDGEINLPVVQGRNNDYYLHRMLDGTWNYAGTLYVDYRNHFLEDDITVIYGHKMKNKTMFGKLDLYDQYSYYEEHPFLRLYTPEAIYELQVIANVYTDTLEQLVFNYGSEEAFFQALQSFIDRSPYKTDTPIEYGDKLVLLYTCAYHTDYGRRFLICKLVQIA